MAVPIKMPFEGWTRVGPRNHMLDGVQIPLERGNFVGQNGGVRYRDTVP